tara:strand:+ start:166 stop:696 length:531 start_codon:yes stop_codon:yes gene_type:complete
MSEKIQEFVINITNAVEATKEYDGDGYYTAFNGEVEIDELEDCIIETLESSLKAILNNSVEGQEIDFTKEEVQDLIDNIEIIIESNIESEPNERDVFSPSLGHGTVTDGYTSTQNITVTMKIKDVNANKLIKDDLEVFMEDFKEDPDGLFTNPEFEEEIKMVVENTPKPKKIKFGR